MLEKIFSWTDKVRVLDVNEQELGIFQAKIFQIGKTFRLYPNENLTDALLTVAEKIFSMRSTYTFYQGGEKDPTREIGKMKAKIFSWRPNYWFEDPAENKTMTMKGDLWGLKYQIYKDDKEIAGISKKFWAIRGTYGIKISPELDDETTMLVLGIVVMLHHEKEEARNRK